MLIFCKISVPCRGLKIIVNVGADIIRPFFQIRNMSTFCNIQNIYDYLLQQFRSMQRVENCLLQQFLIMQKIKNHRSLAMRADNIRPYVLTSKIFNL